MGVVGGYLNTPTTIEINKHILVTESEGETFEEVEQDAHASQAPT